MKIEQIIDKAEKGFYGSHDNRQDRNREKSAFWKGFDGAKIIAPDPNLNEGEYYQAGKIYRSKFELIKTVDGKKELIKIT